MAKRGAARAKEETPLAWAKRVHAAGTEPWRAELLSLARRYYRARFDPAVPAGFGDELVAAIPGFLRGR